MKEPAVYLPVPEDGLEVVYADGKMHFFMYPREMEQVSDKANQLANLIVSKLEPKLMNLKNFPIGTLVSVPHVKCNMCEELAEKLIFTMDNSSEKISHLYLCQVHLDEAQSNPLLTVSEDLNELRSKRSSSVPVRQDNPNRLPESSTEPSITSGPALLVQ